MSNAALSFSNLFSHEDFAVFSFLQLQASSGSKKIDKAYVKKCLSLDTKERKNLRLVQCIHFIFGRQYREKICEKKLDNYLVQQSAMLEKASVEIQLKLGAGDALKYTRVDFPETTKLIDTFSSGLPKEDFFQLLCIGSYETLSYLQPVFKYPSFDRKTIGRLEEITKAGLLALRNLENKNGKIENGENRKGEDIALARLCYGTVAFIVRKEGVVYFSDLLELHPRIKKAVADRLQLSYWVGDGIRNTEEGRRVGAWLYAIRDQYINRCFKKSSFYEEKKKQDSPSYEQEQARNTVFETELMECEKRAPLFPLRGEERSLSLIQCTLLAIEENLTLALPGSLFKQDAKSPSFHRFSFPEFFYEYIWGEFEKDDTLRADLAMYSANLKDLYEREWSHFARPSRPLLQMLQLFLRCVRTYGIYEQRWSSLLYMIFSRDLDCAYSFLSASWEEPCARERDFFSKTWQSLESFPFFSKSTSPQRLSLLLYLLNHKEDAPFWISLFQAFLKNESLSQTLELTPSLFYELCLANPNPDRTVAPELFPNAYMGVISHLQNLGIGDKQWKYLFFSPPVQEFSCGDAKMDLEAAPALVRDLRSSIEPFCPFLSPRQILALVRHFIFHPLSIPLLDLLCCDAPRLGACHFNIKEQDETQQKETEAFICEMLISPWELSLRDVFPYRESALSIATRFQKKFSFPPRDLFLLYLKILEYQVEDLFEELSAASLFVSSLYELCRGVSPQLIRLLYQSSITPDLFKKWKDFIDLRNSWIGNVTEQQKMMLDPDLFRGISDSIKNFAESATNCFSEDERAKWKPALSESLKRAIFPPSQFAADFLQISNIDKKGKVTWRSPHLWTQYGRCCKAMRDSSLRIYMNWNLIDGTPVLFLSVFGLGNAFSNSSFLSLDIPQEEINSQMWEFLALLGRGLLDEEVDDPSYVKSNSYKDENQNCWPKCYKHFENQYNNFVIGIKGEGKDIAPRYRDTLFAFVRKLKVAYRTLYLSNVADLNPYVSPEKGFIEVASEGTSYPLDEDVKRLCLLPSHRQLISPVDLETFSSDGSRETVEVFRSEFAKPCSNFQSLNHHLVVANNQLQKIEIPISYFVQTEKQVALKSTVILDESTGNHLVTLQIEHDRVLEIPLTYEKSALEDKDLFEEQFARHILALKAVWYYALTEDNKKTSTSSWRKLIKKAPPALEEKKS